MVGLDVLPRGGARASSGEAAVEAAVEDALMGVQRPTLGTWAASQGVKLILYGTMPPQWQGNPKPLVLPPSLV